MIFLGTDIESNPDPDSLLLRLIFIVIYAITFLLLLVRWKTTTQYIKKNSWLSLLIALAVISVSWSTIPGISLRKAISLIGTTGFGIYLGTHYKFEEQLKILGWSFGVSILCSFAFIFLLPVYGVMNTEAISGAWRGIYPHKNSLGVSMFISFLSFYIFSLSQPKSQYNWLFKTAALASTILTYFSESATSFVSILLTYGIIKVLKGLSLRSKKSILVILITLIVILILQIIFVINFNHFLAANNKDITLSGRTFLWATIWEFMQLKFWFGYGYGTFFSAAHTETNLLWTVHDWGVMHAHNGYIQLCLDLGIIACLIFVIGYVYNLFKALFIYLAFKKYQMLWIFLFLNYTIFLNFTEVSFFSGNSIIWVVSICAIFSLSTNSSKKKLQ